jgi:Na+/proline symporter
MQGIELAAGNPLGPLQGVITLFGLGLAMLVLANFTRAKLVKNTHDFVIAGRKLGFGFGVAGLLSVWTWVVGILMPAATTFSFGLSGLWWFTVPNGLSVVAVVPFARKLKALMPHGYTISEFVSLRYGGSKLATIVVVAGILFGTLQAVIVNLKGASLVVATIFGMNEGAVAVISSIVVLAYIVLGGLWASIATSTLMCLLIMVPTAIVVLAAVGQVGGVDAIWQVVAAKGEGLLTVTRQDAFDNFGITFTLALITATVAGQEFWNVAWGLRENELGRTFFWGGALYYPIALCLGLLGLVGIALNVDVVKDLGNDSAALAPFLISHLGLPNWVIYLFVIIVLSACYSTVDGALTGVSAITAVDVLHRFFPHIRDSKLFFWTRLSMVITILISVAVVLSGVDFVTLLLVTSVIRGAVLVPLILSIMWDKMNALAFTSGTIVALIAGLIARVFFPGELVSTSVVIVVSAVLPLIIGSLNRDRFDYSILAKAKDI